MNNNMRTRRRRIHRFVPVALLLAGSVRGTWGFAPESIVRTTHVTTSTGACPPHPSTKSSLVLTPVPRRSSTTSSLTSLHMFMGSDGGILGIGGPELFTILLVGYFVLGPSDLYKAVKSIGSFVQNARTLTTDFTKTFETNMESQLQLDEIRKAQRELNDAFSFRRSINVDAEEDAFATTVTTPREGLTEGQDIGMISTAEESDASVDSGASASLKKKKLKRRRRVQPEETVPDLQMPQAVEPLAPSTVEPLRAQSVARAPTAVETMTEEELAMIDAEFDQYTSLEEVMEKQETTSAAEDETIALAAQRFQQQLSGNWNQQVLANSDVLTQVMRKLSLLEEEKAAATKRLEEEFEKRAQLEDQFYQKQREVLESALQQVEKQIVGVANEPSNNVKTE